MHIPDGLITNATSIAAAVAMWIVSLAFLAWSWKKAKATYSHSITALLAGVLGTFMVLLAAFLLGKAITPKNREVSK